MEVTVELQADVQAFGPRIRLTVKCLMSGRQKHLLALEYTDFENTGVRDLDNDGVYAASFFPVMRF